jgi:DNA uptake protein ComE-like DNA-binding protein/mRNA-degrading endonuclease toxin of MazEF toxin-antitoxin module
MANGYFERGEIYWVRMDSGFGYEQGVGRPGVILSCNKQNISGNTLTIAFCSKQPQKAWEIETEATGCTSYVKVAMIQTVDKNRLGKCIGILNSAEMKELEDVLEDYFELGYVDDTALKAKDSEIADRDVVISELQTDIDVVKAELRNKDEEIASLKMEIEMWQKCYGRCMDMLVDMKVSGDVSRRVVGPKVVAPVAVVEAPVVEPVEEPVAVEVEETRLDINSCTATALKKIGFSLAMARKIVESRPFTSVEDLKRVNGLKATVYRIMEPKLCCKPMVAVVEKPQKVEFVKEEDLGYETEVVEAPKVNVNTATAKEINDVTGLSLTACMAITGKRKREGLYKSLDELVIPGRLSENTLAKYRDKMEV